MCCYFMAGYKFSTKHISRYLTKSKVNYMYCYFMAGQNIVISRYLLIPAHDYITWDKHNYESYDNSVC